MPYYIADSSLLSPEAQRLETDVLEAQQQVAELVLDLRGTDYEDEAKQDAENALALQVSLQVATDPEMYLAQSQTRGSRSITYRDGVPIHPLALEIVAHLAAAAAEEAGIIQVRGSATVPLNFSF